MGWSIKVVNLRMIVLLFNLDKILYYITTIVIPLSNVLVDDAEPLCMRIEKRE